MSKEIEGHYVDPDSGTFRWIKKLLEEHEKQVTGAIFRAGDQSETDKLRGRYEEINHLKKALEKAY
jgi:hypothetical protein